MQLTLKQETFCKFYVSRDYFGNGVQAYAEAYGIKISDKKYYNVAKTNAYRLLTNADILKRINELLEESGLNNAHVDKQLYFLITQCSDFSAKIAAIREYNRIKNRIKKEPENPVTAVTHFYIPAKRREGYGAEGFSKNTAGSIPSPAANL